MLRYVCIIIVIIAIILLYKKTENFTEEATEGILKNLTTVYKDDILKVRNIQANNFYPVGSVYLSTNNWNPSSSDVLRFGTWTLLSSGYLYLDTVPNTSIKGSNYITLDNLPQHTHNVTFEANWYKNRQATNNCIGNCVDSDFTSTVGSKTATTTPDGGVSNPSEFRPKYITLSAWYRTA